MLKAHLFKTASRGEREEVKIDLFNMDGSPLDLGGGEAAAPDPYFGKFQWNFADPDFIVDNVPLSFDDVAGSSRVIGFESNDTQLLLPPGIYEYSASLNVNSGNSSGTYLGANLNFNVAEWTEGDPDYLYPTQLSLNSGPDALDPLGREVPYSTSMQGSAWGVAESDDVLEITLSTDFVDLDGDFTVVIARVAAL